MPKKTLFNLFGSSKYVDVTRLDKPSGTPREQRTTKNLSLKKIARPAIALPRRRKAVPAATAPMASKPLASQLKFSFFFKKAPAPLRVKGAASGPALSSVAKSTSSVPAPVPLPGKEILVGDVTHFFPKIQVCVIKAKAEIRKGDKIRFKGPSTDFTQTIASLQVDHQDVEKVAKAAEAGLKVQALVKEGDKVYCLA